MPNKTTEEKIDYIYNHIKTEKKFIYGRRIFKVMMYVFFIGYIVYFYMYWFDKLKDSVIQSVKPDVSSEKIVEWLKSSWWNLLEKAKELYNKNVTNSDSTLDIDNWEY